MTAGKLATWMIVMALLVVVGCNNKSNMVAAGDTSREASVLARLLPQARPPIPDLPVPLGFSLVQKKSRSFAAAGARYIDHVYAGGGEKFAVQRFYKQYMPISRWTLVTDMFVQGDIQLDFEKQTERCRITITDGSLFNPVSVEVALWTSGRIVPIAPPGEMPSTNNKKN